MKRIGTGAAVLVLAVPGLLFGHDMWLEAEQFVVAAGQEVVVRNGNGTIYVRSENAVAPDRIERLLALGPDGNEIPLGEPFVEGSWLAFRLQTAAEGSYWAGLSTRPRLLKMSAADFNQYLEHDGLPHVLAERRKKGIEGRDESERYSKHVKTLLQAGEGSGGGHDRPLGLKIEIVPLSNPYRLQAGGELPVQVLYEGHPLEGFLIHSGRTGEKERPQGVYTDGQGRASTPIDAAGRWYLRGIHIFEVEGADHSYESYWASLTFEVR